MHSKSSEYQLLLDKVAALTAGESDSIANMANISAVLYHGLPDINWAGFYIHKNNQLVLGPFQGKPACIRIPLGRGVCGTAAEQQKAQVIDNVHAFSGHIACDVSSNSEVVIPIVKNGQLLAVLDLDSPSFSRFDNVDLGYLSKIVDIFTKTIIDNSINTTINTTPDTVG
jgi:L-methionine (R)-S-oxide reductase